MMLMYVGINIILTVSLNLVNGYMGEFSVGHAGFMAVGAYVSSILTVRVFPSAWQSCSRWRSSAAASAPASWRLLVAFPSFRDAWRLSGDRHAGAST